MQHVFAHPRHSFTPHKHATIVPICVLRMALFLAAIHPLMIPVHVMRQLVTLPNAWRSPQVGHLIALQSAEVSLGSVAQMRVPTTRDFRLRATLYH